MKDKRNLHQKIQELCDCFATTDPLAEMATVPAEGDTDEAALKWLALAVLHGVTANAEKIELSRHPEGGVEVRAKYREAPLRSPGSEVAAKILEAAKHIVGLEESEGSSRLALGIRDSSLELKIKVEQERGRERLVIKFPDR
jgi:hypothetical protein